MGSIPTKLLKTFEILFIMEGMTRINLIIQDMPSERKLNVSLSMKIKGESTSVKVLPWDPFATFIVTVCVFVRHLFSRYPFYFDFHSARIIFDVSSGFYLWNINNTKADICKKMIPSCYRFSCYYRFSDIAINSVNPPFI